MAEAEAIGATAVVWYLARDPEDAPVPAFSPLATTGLVKSDGRPKTAWIIWRTYAGRPPLNP
jgi:hypothetical protein